MVAMRFRHPPARRESLAFEAGRCNVCPAQAGGVKLTSMVSSPIRFPRRFLLSTLCLMSLAVGCEDKRRHQPTQQVTFSSSQPGLAAGAAPLDVARSALDAMIQLQRARRDGLGAPDRLKSYESAIGRLHALVARDQIHKSIVESKAYPADIEEAAAVTLIVESWTAMLAHYVDGIDLNLARVKSTQSGNAATVYVAGVNPDDAKKLAAIRSRLPSGTGVESDKRLRDEALKQGLNLPIETGIEVRLTRGKGDWLVSNVKLVLPLPAPTAAVPANVTGATTGPSSALSGD